MDEPNEVILGTAGWIEYEKNPRDITLCRYFWPATTSKAKAVIIVVHGHGTHTCFEFLKLRGLAEVQGYDDSFVKRANEEGFSVCGIDFQGHGRSDSYNNIRCYVNKFQDYVDDVLHFANYISGSSKIEKFSGLPIFILGISLGGCIAVNCIHQKGDLFRGAVLFAPMLSLEKVSKTGLNPYLRPLASLISTVLPTAPVVQLRKNEKFPDIQDAFDNDPLCFKNNTRARLGAEYLSATERTLKEFPEMKFPFITFHSREDEMTDFEGSWKLKEESASTDKELQEANDQWHFLLKEPGYENREKKAFEWMHARVKGQFSK
jgi:acylglycerol lipase